MVLLLNLVSHSSPFHEITTTAAAILHRPNFNPKLSRISELYRPKPISFLQFSSTKSVFLGGFASDIAPTRKRKNMSDLIETAAFRRGSDEESVGILHQEAVGDGSKELLDDGLEATLNSLSKWLVTGLFGAVVLWRHDAEALWVAVGSIVNGIFSLTLKKILNQERPFPSSKSDPGMPSSHAQSIFYTVTFAIFSIVESFGVNDFTLIGSALTLAFGSYLSWLRVSRRLHTVSQVAVGAVVGSIFSLVWYWSWNAFVLQAFETLVWVRIVVFLAAAGFGLMFLAYVIRHWFSDELFVNSFSSKSNLV